MSGAGDEAQVAVVSRARVGVLDKDAEWGAAGCSMGVQARDDPGRIGLLTARVPGEAAWGAACDEGTERVEVGGEPRGKPLDERPDSCSVRLAEDAHTERRTER